MINKIIIGMLFGWFLSISVTSAKAEVSSLQDEDFSQYESTIDDTLLNNTAIRILQAGKDNLHSVLLVHGLGENGVKDWRNVIPQLAQEYHVIAIDLPGFGESAINTEVFSPQHYAELLHRVKQKYAKSNLIVIGHSLGGAISLKYVDLYPQDIQKLVLVSVAGVLQRSVYVRYLSQIKNEPDENEGIRSGFMRATFGVVNSLSTAFIELADKLPHVESLIINNALARDYLFSNQQTLKSAVSLMGSDFSLVLANIQIPTHIIWGDIDPVSSMRVAKVLSLHVAQSTLNVVVGAGHVPMSTHPQIFNQLLHMQLKQTLVKKKESLPLVAPRLSQQNIHCKDKAGLRFTGIFNEIVLDKCRNIQFDHVYANRIIMRDSTVVFNQLSVDGSGVAMQLYESKMSGDNLMLKAKLPMSLEESWIDVAGGYLIGEETLVKTDGESKIYFSVSKGKSHKGIYSLHGEYDDETKRL